MIEAQSPRCERMTGLSRDQLADLVAPVREAVGDWEKPAIGRPHALPLLAALVALLFRLRHNVADDVVAEVFGYSLANVTRYQQQLGPILRWVLRPETDEQFARAQREGVIE
jgi:hypothetical protein